MDATRSYWGQVVVYCMFFVSGVVSGVLIF